MNRPLSIATLLALLACCGGTAAPGAAENSCTITISGAETATKTQDCVPSAAVNSAGTAAFDVGMMDTSFGEVQFTGEFSGSSFQTGTYDQTSLKVDVTLLSNPANSATTWEQTNTADGGMGTVKLVISSTGTQLTASGGAAWYGSHGTLDATLPPAAGNVSTTAATVHMTF